MTATLDEQGAGLPDLQNANWLRTLRRYMGFIAGANLVWEFAHLPLYTLWETGTRSELVFAGWPATGGRGVAVLTLVFGLAYTLFSEWLNIEVREAWAYRDLMPGIPLIDAGLSPVLQWIAVPLAAYWWAMRPVRNAQANTRRIGEPCRPSRQSLDTESTSFALDQSRD